MTDPYLSELDEQIKKLQEERERRTKQLEDPTYQQIRAEYQKIWDALEALDRLGENPDDGNGYAVHVQGKNFSISHDGIRVNK